LVQARGQLKIIFNTVPVSEVLNDPEMPDSIKKKIRWVQEVRSFAGSYLGLTVKKNYTTYYDQQGKELMWVVTACEPYHLISYTWDFPVLGSFTYKGFFIPEMADQEAARLKAQGFDTSIRNAGGWSTLGILKDPILSGMLDRPDDALAELIIHELTHATIFIRDDVSFNENLASFVGMEGTKVFLSQEYGPASDQLRNYVEMVEDRDSFSHYVLKGASKLEDFYSTFNPEWSEERKHALKSEWYENFIASLDTVDFHDPGRYRDYFEKIDPNNTLFMSFLRYRGGLGGFEKTLNTEFEGDLRQYIAFLRQKYH
jgi:predicted aminopeptidase